MAGNPKRSKAYGYEVERAAEHALSVFRDDLKRTGSVAYRKAAADLAAPGHGECEGHPPIRLIVTRDKGRPLLVTGTPNDLQRFYLGIQAPVVVQVKGRARTWIGTLYDALKGAT